jgi:hypothetical protein
MSVTWNNQPGFGDSYGSADVVADTDWRWHELDVTGLVQDWVNGTYANEGIMLRGEEASGSESSRRSFYTREGDHPPELRITYTSTAGVQSASSVEPHAGDESGVSILRRLNASPIDGHGSGREYRAIP